MRRLHGMVGGLVVMLTAMVFAKPGVVITKDGNRFDGEVTERDALIDIVSGGRTVTIKRLNVQSITYTADFADQFNQKLSGLPKDDVRGRIDLAQSALDSKQYELARTALEQARSTEPNNSTVLMMLQRIELQLRPKVVTSAPAAPATNAATPPVATVGGDAPPLSSDAAPAAKRMVTQEEINVIRQTELKDDSEKVRMRIDPDTVKRYLNISGMSIADFNALTITQKGWLILTQNRAELSKGVHILSDPAAIEEFKKTVSRTLIAGCATSNCHGGNKGGNFVLFPSDSESAVYSDFLILNEYSKTVGKLKYRMIDRSDPPRSLLLNYMLPPELAEAPHPKGSYHGSARTATDPRFVAALTWIRDVLKPVQPMYTIDLSKAPPDKAGGGAGAGLEKPH